MHTYKHVYIRGLYVYSSIRVCIYSLSHLHTSRRHTRRHIVINPTKKEDELDLTELLAYSILDQAHLCPLPLETRPVYWELDYTLRLTPLPHLLILADKVDQYSYCYKDCNVVNPGTLMYTPVPPVFT